METGKPEHVDTRNHIKFKSYYVVWKLPLRRSSKGYKTWGFKSYYVVWKRRFAGTNKFVDKKFKSYYVVWKHASFFYMHGI